MKTRDSGMPVENQWESYFNARTILDRLGLIRGIGDVVEFGCGYGTFTIPAAQRSVGIVHALDIDSLMVEMVASKARKAGLLNVSAAVRDFVTEGTGVADRSADYAMLFNILHAENPHVLLREAWRVLRPTGILGVIHWNYDPATPRGPSMDIRPQPTDCLKWARDEGFVPQSPIIDMPPYHYGMQLYRPR